MNRIEKAHEAFKKPRKWYREHSKDEAIEILKLEAKQ